VIGFESATCVSKPTDPTLFTGLSQYIYTLHTPSLFLCKIGYMSQRYHNTSNDPNASVTFASTSRQSPSNSRPVSRTPSRATSYIKEINGKARHSDEYAHKIRSSADGWTDFDSDREDMGDRRPGLHRPTDGRSHQPLLNKDDEDVERGRGPISDHRPPLFTRRSTMRSRSPDTQAKLATKKKYTYAAFFLGLSLVSFVIQTETAVYIQHELGWNKAYCML